MLILNRYEVLKCIGVGSTGSVYLCAHRELPGFQCAVKVLFPRAEGDESDARRLMNSVASCYAVSHPNVIKFYEFIRDGEHACISMEYAPGGDLASKLTEEISVPECLRILSAVCAGVQAIHDAGILHGAIKPEDILFMSDGTVKVSDFGSSGITASAGASSVQGASASIDYAAPEYLASGKFDWRSDIYAVGCLAYEMLVGEHPFSGSTVLETMTKRLKGEVNSPCLFRSECPSELGDLILKAMHLDPGQRFQSAAEMFNALQAFRGNQSEALVALPVKAGPA